MSIVRVAKAAGVSTATVSRVMNDLPGVRPETVALVRAAVEELNYKPRRPSPAIPAAVKPRRRRRGRSNGRALASDIGLRTGNIAVVTVGHSADWLQRPVLGEALGGIQRGVTELGLRLILEEMPDPDRATPLMTGRQVDGVIVFMASHAAAAGEQTFNAIREHVPVVWVMGTSVENVSVDHVTTDNVAIGQLAATHLRDKGCDRLAFFTANPDWSLSRLRGQNFANRAADAKLPCTSYLVTDTPDAYRTYGADAVASPTLEAAVARIAKDAKAHKGTKVGLFVCVDYEMAQIHPLLGRHGLVIDRDIEVLSCDNESARLAAMQPRPLSIDTGAGEIGFRAVVRLLARVQRPEDRPLTIMVAPTIGKA